MDVKLSTEQEFRLAGEVSITGSKSEANRLLVLQAMYPNLQIENLSTSDDTSVLKAALAKSKGTVDIHHAGTAMRFLTAYYAAKPDASVVLTGSDRMQQRPIKILVDALRSMGADITYQGKEGYPPLAIKGKVLESNEVRLDAGVSSQYISALMLIAPSMPKGLRIHLEGTLTSVPYIEMTAALLRSVGAVVHFEGNQVRVQSLRSALGQDLIVESDWSAASYYYSMVALNKGSSVALSSFRTDSYQGDAALSKIYQQLGVTTSFDSESQQITLRQAIRPVRKLELNLVDTPDIAQTIAVTCFGLGIACELRGLHTLKIKETDRLEALRIELSKLGATIDVNDHSLHLEAATKMNPGVRIDTYQDHRMAMAFAPLALRLPLVINQAEVVSKSYPEYWDHLAHLGFCLEFE